MSDAHGYSIPPATSGGPGSSALLIPFTATMGPRRGETIFYVSAVGEGTQLWEYALLIRKLQATAFKIVSAAENGLYLSKEITAAEYNAL